MASQVEATQDTLYAVDLAKSFPGRGSSLGRKGSDVLVVDGVSLEVRPGETTALVGESGCGKSTTARMLLGLSSPTSGAIRFGTHRLDGAKRSSRLRGRIQIVFQDASAALNPRKTIYQTMRAPLLLHGVAARSQVRDVVVDLLEQVGLAPADELLDRYPQELSGGQQQRVVIARALSTDPDVIVADEPVSSLDVSVQAQVLTLLKRLQRERGVGYLLISHDLAVVRALAHRVAVMYLGKIVEEGTTADVFGDPKHPYTRTLLASIPSLDPDAPLGGGSLIDIGEAPSPENRPEGCAFHPRCPLAIAKCKSSPPTLGIVDDGSASQHKAACHLVNIESI